MQTICSAQWVETAEMTQYPYFAFYIHGRHNANHQNKSQNGAQNRYHHQSFFNGVYGYVTLDVVTVWVTPYRHDITCFQSKHHFHRHGDVRNTVLGARLVPLIVFPIKTVERWVRVPVDGCKILH